MAIYYMNEDITKRKRITGKSGVPSEYQDLIDQYLANGGTIKYIETDVRSLDKWHIKEKIELEDEVTIDKPPRGGATDLIMDQRLRDKSHDPESYFDKRKD